MASKSKLEENDSLPKFVQSCLYKRKAYKNKLMKGLVKPMETKEQEEFGINVFRPFGTHRHLGIITIIVPKYNEYGNIINFDTSIARFREEDNKLVPVNDVLGNLSEVKLASLYSVLHNEKPKANKVKILPPLKSKLLKFE